MCIISPFQRDRNFARSLFAEGSFIEVFVDTPMDVIIKRDPKGHYQNAQKGLIENFTGIGSDYERPENPEIVIDTEKLSVEESINQIKEHLGVLH